MKPNFEFEQITLTKDQLDSFFDQAESEARKTASEVSKILYQGLVEWAWEFGSIQKHPTGSDTLRTKHKTMEEAVYSLRAVLDEKWYKI